MALFCKALVTLQYPMLDDQYSHNPAKHRENPNGQWSVRQIYIYGQCFKVASNCCPDTLEFVQSINLVVISVAAYKGGWH